MNGARIAEKPLKILIDTERVADQVLQSKQEIIELDKRRQSTREALRLVEKSNEKNAWVTVGPILIKMERKKAIEMLTNDQKTIDVEINKLRSNQKILVSELRDLEHQSPMSGFDLKPLDRNEVNALAANLPTF